VVTSLRLGIGSRTGIYGALEAEIGGLVRDSAGAAEMTSSGVLGTPTIAKTSAMVMSGLGVLGVRAGERNRFGIEVAGGMRNVSYHYTSHYLACENEMTVTASQKVLELRARASTWLTPFLSLGATAGASVIDRGDWMAGLYLGVHTHAFAGNR
jgi:hypothetical protein